MLAQLRGRSSTVAGLVLWATLTVPGLAVAGPLRALIGAGLPQFALREHPFVAEPPSGVTITVTTTGGAPIGPIHDGEITVWEAIYYANADPNPNLINFDQSLLGQTVDVGLLDWHTMTGNYDVLDGSFGSGRPHIRLADSIIVRHATGVTIRGVCVNSVRLTGTRKCHVESCHFGLSLDGKTTWQGAGLVEGVWVNDDGPTYPSKGNVIGGRHVVHRNFFAGDSPGYGGGPVLIGDYCSDNWVFNNNIGLGRDDKPVENTPWGGVSVQGGAHDNHVGDWPNRWNTVVCTEAGVYLDGANTQHNVVRSNYLGYHSGGTRYAHYGVAITGGAHDNVIGGPVANDYLPNVIDYCDTAGVSIGPGCVGNRIYGTYIGVDQEGWPVEKGGGQVGIEVGMNSVGTRIGGADTWKNWIAGQSGHCIEVLDGATGVVISGNFIGFATGAKPFFQRVTPGDGIFASGTANVRIGGVREAPVGYVNVIGGCSRAGIKLSNCTGPVTVQSNWLGIAPGFGSSIQNGTDIEVLGSKNVLIGTDQAEATAGEGASKVKPPPSAQRGNVVSFARRGVHIGSSQNVTVAGNLIGSDNHGGEYQVRECGVVIDNDSSQVDIGGDASSQANRIRQCPQGILVTGGAHGVQIVGNDMRNSVQLVGDQEAVRVEGGAHNVVVRGNAIQWWAVGVALAGEVRNVTLGATAAGQSGNQITWNQLGGVWIEGGLAYDNQVVGNWIGVLPSDDPLKPLKWVDARNFGCGIKVLDGAHGNVIGADANGTPNRICANWGPGVWLTGGAHHNVIRNSIIGPERPENEITGNTKGGVLIDAGAHDNTVGGSGPAHLTYIGGNTGNGVTIMGAGSDNNRVVNCGIGLCGYQTEAVSYSFPCGNTGHGVHIGEGAKGNALGVRSLDIYSNVISANGGDGVHIQGAGTTGNQVSRCRIGTDPTGNQAEEIGPHPKTWANRANGVQILQGAQGNIVGGVNNAFGNQISNNRADGVYLGQQSVSNDVLANLIGTRADGAQALGNKGVGVFIEADCSQNHIGNGQPRAENTVSGNAFEGVLIWGSKNTVARNFVGTDPLGGTAVPNGRAGIRIVAASENQVVSGNVVSGNRGDGVAILGGTSEGNVVDGNTIGLTKSATRFLPNGTTAPGTGAAVLIAPQGGGVAIPNATQVSNNWLYGTKCGVRFAAQSFGDEAIPAGNRATGNKIGVTSGGRRKAGDVGLALIGCPVYVAANEIAGQGVGVQARNATAYACVRSCNFHDNQCDAQFLAGAAGLLGDAGSPRSWERGQNVFGLTSHCAIDVHAGKPDFMFKAENNDWGTQSKAAIEGRIRFRQGDTSRTSVDYDPLIGGIHPTGALIAGPALVTALAAQPTPQGAAITVSLSAEAAVALVVMNLAGRPIRTVLAERSLPAGTSTVLWNGVSDAGTRVPPGSYLVRISVRSAGGRQVRAMRTLTLGQAVR